VAWKDAGEPVFGLHFGGWTIDTNYAHACSEIRTEIEKVVATM
jgi:hypothetical protein